MANKLNVNNFDSDVIRQIAIEVSRRLGEYKRTHQIIRDGIFDILEMNAKVLYYPIADDELCGFILRKNNHNFVFINTNVPLEKQVVAAGHELYHLWCSNENELLKSSDLDEEKHEIKYDELTKEDMKANRFAAEFLVSKTVLINELDLRGIQRNTITLKEVVELMDIFLVPYQTIVRRLFEINYLDEVMCLQYLNIPARAPEGEVMMIQRRFGLCERNNERTRRIELAQLTDASLTAYERRLITLEKLDYLLELEGKNSKNFGITEENDYLSENEIHRIMEDDDEW